MAGRGRSCIENGTLEVICRYPEATSLEDLLVDLRLGLEELKPMAEHTAPCLSIADAILALDYSTAGYELDRRLRVIKMRGSNHGQHPYRLHIEPGGLRTVRLTAEEAEAMKRRGPAIPSVARLRLRP